MMTTFHEWYNKDKQSIFEKIDLEKFQTMYDIETYISGQNSPNTYQETMRFYNRLPKKPGYTKGVKLEEGKFGTVVFTKQDKLHLIDFDFVRRTMNISVFADGEESEIIPLSRIPFQDLL